MRLTVVTRRRAFLEAFRRQALRAIDDDARTAAIDQANEFLRKLQEDGSISTGERLQLGREWVQAFTREHLRELYRRGDHKGVRQWGGFLTEKPPAAFAGNLR